MDAFMYVRNTHAAFDINQQHQHHPWSNCTLGCTKQCKNKLEKSVPLPQNLGKSFKKKKKKPNLQQQQKSVTRKTFFQNQPESNKSLVLP